MTKAESYLTLFKDNRYIEKTIQDLIATEPWGKTVARLQLTHRDILKIEQDIEKNGYKMHDNTTMDSYVFTTMVHTAYVLALGLAQEKAVKDKNLSFLVTVQTMLETRAKEIKDDFDIAKQLRELKNQYQSLARANAALN